MATTVVDPTVDQAARFARLKQQREECSRKLAGYEGKISASKERFQSIMRELAQQYQIYSYDDLVKKRQELEAQIDQEETDLEQTIQQMQRQIEELERLAA